jgi:hypothetical protein
MKSYFLSATLAVVLRLFGCDGGGSDPVPTPAAAPTFNPPGGTYTASQSVAISSTTPGATIYCTSDGSDPTTASPVCSGGVAVTADLTLKAFATAPGFATSPVASASYVIALPAATPVITPGNGTFTLPQSVSIDCSTPGASIYYTTDGSPPSSGTTLYTGSLWVATDATVSAIAYAPGHVASEVATAIFNIVPSTPAATPVITPGGGRFAAAQTVSITSSTPGATVYYTTDGRWPTSGSTPYTGTFQVSSSANVNAIAYAPGFLPSAVSTATLFIAGGEGDFATFCAGIDADFAVLTTSCLKANPDWVATQKSVGCENLLVDIQAGRFMYDAAHGAACRASFTSAGCAALQKRGGGLTAECKLAMLGQGTSGSVCYNEASCDNLSCGMGMGGGCPGVCMPYPQIGESCAIYDCAPGLACDASAGPGVCKVPSGEGGPCPCQTGFFCDGSNLCAPLQASGFCASPDGCAIGYACVGSPGSCQPTVGAGGACSNALPGPTECGPGYHCAAGICAADPKVGEPCTSGQACIGATCDGFSSTCVAWVDPFPACSSAPSEPGLTLLDGFGGPSIDGTKWYAGSMSRMVAGGAAVLGLDVTNARPRADRNDTYGTMVNPVPPVAGQRTSSLRADIRVPAATATRTGGVNIRATLRLSYSPPSQRLNFWGGAQDMVMAEVGLIDEGSGLYAFRRLTHCDNASCTTLSTSGITFVDPVEFAPIGVPHFAGAAAAYDTTYTVSLRLDEATGIFHWSVAGGGFGAGVSGTADPAVYLAATANWSGIPLAGSGYQGSAMGVSLVNYGAVGSGGRILGNFDNVLVGFNGATATAFDDFSGTGGNSGPTELSPARWNAPGYFTSGLQNGSLVVEHQITSVTSNQTTAGQVMTLGDPPGFGTLLVDGAVLAHGTTGTGSGGGYFGIGGRFYNDGSSTRLFDATGDVSANLLIQVFPGTAYLYLNRCNNPTCSTSTFVGTVALPGATGLNVGGHRLRLSWDAIARRFTFGVDGVIAQVDPTTAGGGVTNPIAYGGPARFPLRYLNSSAWVTSGNVGQTTGLTVRFTDLFTGP